MITINFHRLMKKKELTVAQISRETGLIRNTIRLLKTGEAQQVDLRTLDLLCKLFNCTVNDILEYNPTTVDSDDKSDISTSADTTSSDKKVNYDKWVKY